MESRELRYFAQVARAGSFSRAALELRIAQPALSRQIRKLEENLGVDLFERNSRGVRLTEAGSLLLERAEQISSLLQQTHDLVRTREEQAVGHITLGVPPVAGLLLTPPVVVEFRPKWPRVSLSLREGNSSSLCEWLLSRLVDVAVMHNPPLLEDIETRPLLTEYLVLVGPANGPPLRSYQIRELADLPLIMSSQPNHNRRALERVAIQHDIRLRIAMEVNSIALTKAMIREGFGYSVMTYASVAVDVAQSLLRAYPIERPHLTSSLVIATLRGASNGPAITDLIQIIQTVADDLVSRGTWRRAITPAENNPLRRLSESIGYAQR